MGCVSSKLVSAAGSCPLQLCQSAASSTDPAEPTAGVEISPSVFGFGVSSPLLLLRVVFFLNPILGENLTNAAHSHNNHFGLHLPVIFSNELSNFTRMKIN